MRPPKFIPTCDSILIPNVASTLQWKRRRIRRVAWYAEDDFNVNPTSSLSCHVSCADFFRRRALFLPLTRRPTTGIVGRLPWPPCLLYVQHWNICSDQFPRYFFVNVSACRVVSRGHVPLYAVIACDVTVHDRGRAVPVAVVHGRRACGRGVVAVITAVPCPPWPSVMSWLWP